MTARDCFRGAAGWAFRQLYHSWAWAYDSVAMIVSLGRWYEWVDTVRPFIVGPRVLEIGPGTGHLLELMADTEAVVPFGLDESPQMLRLAHRRSGGRVPLVRAFVQHLPLDTGTLDTIVATFPTEFARDRNAISEQGRALRPGGRLVILPLAQIVGRTPVERFMAWALALVGEAPRDSRGEVSRVLLPPLEQAGFEAVVHELHERGSTVLVIVATKPF